MSPALQARLARLRAPDMPLMLVAFTNDLSVACIALGVQQFAIRMGATPLQSGLLGTFGSASYALGCFLAGSVSDRWGRKRPTILACAVCSTVWLAMLLARSPNHLLALMPLSGFSLSLLWPPMQAWLSEFSAGSRERLNRTMALFNLCWTAGIMLGPLVAGLVWDWHWWMAFVLPAVMTYAMIVALVRTPTHEHVQLPPPEAHPIHPERVQLFLYMAWLGNFASWFTRGVVGSMFPQLSAHLGFSSAMLGLLTCLLSAAMFTMFVLTRRERHWQYNFGTLLLAEIVGMVGMLFAAVSHSPLMFAGAFIASGLCSGVTYAGSLFYALDGAHQNRGRRSSLHEAVLGSGAVLGPLVGGALGQLISLHAPYAASGVVFGLAIVGQLVLWRRARPRLAAEVHADAPAAV